MPASPANNNDPLLKGSAEAGSSVHLYKADTAADCTPANLVDSQPAATFASPGISAHVGDDTTTRFRASATDAASNTSACSAAFDYTEDSTPPAATIDSAAHGTTGDSTPSFDFSSSEDPGSSFACSLDQGTPAYSTCTSPFTSAALSDGDHTFRVRATDQAGNTGAAATEDFTVDTGAPAAPTITASVPASPANNNDPLLKGSAEAGSSVHLYKADTAADCTPANLVDSQPAATFASPGISAHVGDDTTTRFRASATDAASNTSACSAAFDYTEDSTPPAATIDSAAHGTTGDSTPSFDFSSSEDPGSSFACSLDQGTPAYSTCTSPFTSAALSDGDHTFRVRATDQAGNTGAAATEDFTVDTGAPAAPTITASVPASPANNNDPLLKGSAEAGSSVHLYKADTAADCTPANLVDSQPAATFASPGISAHVGDDTTTRFRASATDAASNTSACSAAFDYTEDSTPPAATIDSAAHGTTGDSTPSFDFSSSEDPGSSFACSLDQGTPAYSTCTSPFTSAALSDGDHTFRVRATDQAGNTGAAATEDFTVDTGAPAAPTITASVPASPANNNDPLLKGSAEAGSSVHLYKADTAADCTPANLVDSQPAATFASPGISAHVGDDTTTRFRASATDAASNTSACSAAFDYTEDSTPPAATIDSAAHGTTGDSTPSFDFSSSEDPGSSFACSLDQGTPAYSTCTSPFTSAALSDGDHTFRVRATDQAGNTGAAATEDFTVDTGAPAAPTITASVPASPANNNDPLLKGSAEAGSSVHLYKADTAADCTPANLVDSQPAATFASPGISAHVGDDTTTRFRASATDAASNTSACSAAFDYTEDSTPPAATIDSAAHGTTGDSTPSFDFSSSEDPGSSFACSLDQGTPAYSTCTSPFTSAALSDGDHTFRVRATDQAGNTGAAATEDFTVDTGAPAAPTITASVPASPANNNDPLLKGSAEAGSSVHLYKADTAADCTPANLVDSQPAATFASPGISAHVGDDTTTRFRASATDAASNTSACSAAFDYTEDSTPPAATIDSAAHGTTGDSTPSFDFSSSEDPGSSFACSLDQGTPAYSTCTSPFTSAALSDGDHTFRVRATDQAGNTGAAATEDFTVDTGAPAAPTITASVPASPANNNDPLLKGSAEAGSSVHLYKADTAADCTPANLVDSQPAATFASPGISAHVGDDTTTRFRASATDAASNTSACSAAFDYTEDSTPPAATIDSAAHGTTGDSTPSFDFSSSEDPGSSFACSLDQGTPAYSTCTSPFTSAALSDGDHTFRVRATDQAGNTGAAATEDFTVDTGAPAAPTITASVPASPANNNDPLLKGSAEAGSSVHLYKADTAADCTPANLVDSQPAATFASPGISAHVGDDTTTRFRASATDAASNTSACSAAFDYTEDSTPPAATIDSAAHGTTGDSTPSFDFSSSEDPGSSFACSLDQGTPAYSTCTSPFTSAALSDGDHTFRVRATDQAGNTGAAATEDFTVDTGAPAAPTITASVPASPANNNDPLLKGSAEAGSSVHLYKADTAADCTPANLVDSQPAATFASPGISAHVGDDTTTRFRASATDAASNTSACSAAFDYTEDSTPPAATIDSAAHGTTGDSTPSFDFSSSEDPGSSFACSLDQGTPPTHLHQPLHLGGALRRRPHLPGAGHRPGRQHRRRGDRGLHGRHRRPRRPHDHRLGARLAGQQQRPAAQGQRRGRLERPPLQGRHRRRLHPGQPGRLPARRHLRLAGDLRPRRR